MSAPDFFSATLVDALVEQVLVQRFWADGRLVDPCSILFLRTSDVTLRLFFDHGTFFCRVATADDLAVSSDPDGQTRHDLVEPENAALVTGQVIEEARRVEVPGPSVRIRFENGRLLTLTNVHDRNDLVIS